MILGRVKESVTAQLLPPNRIFWEDAFDGIKASALVVWKHNAFTHDVILAEQPELPFGWDETNVRLEVTTELSLTPNRRCAQI